MATTTVYVKLPIIAAGAAAAGLYFFDRNDSKSKVN